MHLQQASLSGQRCHTGVSRGSPRPFSFLQTSLPGAYLQTKPQRKSITEHSRQGNLQTKCVAPNTQGVGRRVVGSVATAAFLTWALRSASAKSMKPADVQRRSKEEENAMFENREGEVCRLQALALSLCLKPCRLQHIMHVLRIICVKEI